MWSRWSRSGSFPGAGSRGGTQTRTRPSCQTQGAITIPGYTHIRFKVDVEQMEPERLFSWRWQPGGDPNKDPAEPPTLVVFELEEVPEGTRVTVTETGFDR